MLGYLSAIRLNHVECGSLLPLFAARACPGVLLALTGNANLPTRIFALRRHPERSCARFASRVFRGRATQSKDLSSI